MCENKFIPCIVGLELAKILVTNGILIIETNSKVAIISIIFKVLVIFRHYNRQLGGYI